MKRTLISCIIGVILPLALYPQEYWGAGDDEGVQVTSSSSWSPRGWNRSAAPDNTINGNGLDARILETSRFLAQATLGADPQLINEVAAMDFEEWLDEQAEIEPTSYLETLEGTWEEVVDWYEMNGGDPEEIYGPYWKDFNYAWWTANMTMDDVLRHRVALALSEIFVVSINSDLGGYGWGLASYYDVLYNNALGNYRDLLEQVTLHVCMGFYLSHLNNPKSDPDNNIRPDENYAREVMQLFSIGLYELNQDGTRKTDANGDPIPTYGQEEISEFAKVFTGLGISEIREIDWLDSAQFDLGIYTADLTKPMKMYEEWHEPGPKNLLNGTTVPGGQGGMQDIQDALNNLYNHPNVGPFIGRLLIQRLVKSNPSPGYISRVAAAFNNDGEGNRGNLHAVVKAILLDEEARSCDAMNEPYAARLREPLVRYAHYARSVEKEHVYGRYWNVNYGFMDNTGMSPLWAPSVFNFFLPDFQPQGEIADNDLYGPEYQIHNTKLSVGFINEANNWIVWNNLLNDWEEGNPNVSVNVDVYKEFAQDPETLLNELDKVYTHGALTDETRTIIKDAISQLIYSDYKEDRVRLAMYLIMISPDYAVMR